MFNTHNFLSGLSQSVYHRATYYPSAWNRHGFVCGSNTDIIILSDSRPKSIVARRNFWKRFRQSCDPHKIELIAATKIARVFTIDRKKYGAFLFVDNNIAVEMIKKSGLEISTFIGVKDGCCEGGNHECVNEIPFFGKVLDLMPDSGGMHVVTDHSPYLFDGTWGEPLDGDFSFVVKDISYNASLIGNQILGFKDRVCEFIVRKSAK